MRTASLVALALALALAAAAAPAAAKPVAGVDMPDTLTAGGASLKLNGAGVRKKFVIKVYAGGLYTEDAVKNEAALLGSDKPWAVRMHFLRGVEKEKILGAYKEGFEKNSKDKLAEIVPGLDKLNAALTDAKDGTVMIVRYAPGKGTTVSIEGGPSVTVEGKAFAEAMLKNWIGPFPADAGLKKDMLAGS